MARNPFVRFLGYPSRRDYLFFALVQSLYLLSCFLYSLSLEGGDLEYLKAKTTYFAVLLVLSVLIAFAATMLSRSAFSTTNSTLKIACWALGATATAVTVTRDLGTSLASHGQFNLIVYFLIWLPVAAGTALVEGCNAAKKRVSNARM